LYNVLTCQTYRKDAKLDILAFIQHIFTMG
jgi:hypothetical protein